MAWVLVTGQTAALSNATTISPTVAVPNPITSGNIYCGAVLYGSAQTLNSITDDKSNTYNLKITTTQTVDALKLTLFELGNITNGPKTLTFNFSAATDSCAVVGEFSGGLAVSDPADGSIGQQQSAVASGANNVTSTAFTPTTDGDLILGASSDTASLTANSLGTSPNAFTNVNTASNSTVIASLRLEFFVQTTHASIAATFGIAVNADNAVSNVLALKPAAGVATNPFLSTDLFAPLRIRASPFDKSVALNPNLFKNPFPFNTYDYPKVWDIRQAPYDLSVQTNPNLFTNPYPFNQYDWSKPKRVSKAPYDLSVQTNPNLFKNPIPILNVQGFITNWGVSDLPVPQQPYNQSLYSITVTVTLMGQVWT